MKQKLTNVICLGYISSLTKFVRPISKNPEVISLICFCHFRCKQVDPAIPRYSGIRHKPAGRIISFFVLHDKSFHGGSAGDSCVSPHDVVAILGDVDGDLFWR